MPSRRPLAVVLDMDGTLLDTEPLASRAWGDAAAAIGATFDASLPDRLIGRNFADCRALIAAHHGDRYPVDALMAAWHVAYDAIVEREGLALKPGVLALFDWLDAEGLPRAVATSTRRRRALAKLERVELASRLDALVGGDEVARGKPAPDIFVTAAARLAVDPAACLAVEDSDAGVRSALAAGMTAAMVPDLLPPGPAIVGLGARVHRSLGDLVAHLDRLPRR